MCAAVALAALVGGARADGAELDTQLQLQSTLLYSSHWYSGRDPGAAFTTAERRASLLPAVWLWRNQARALVHLELARATWDLIYSFGYDAFLNQTGFDTFENRLEALGRISLTNRTALVLVERAAQTRFNVVSTPGLGALAASISGFDVSRLYFLSAGSSAMLDHQLSARWELRPEAGVDVFKAYGTVPPGLGVLGAGHAIGAVQLNALHHWEQDVLQLHVGGQYVWQGSIAPLPVEIPQRPYPISQAAYAKDYLVGEAWAGWTREVRPWLDATARLGVAANRFVRPAPNSASHVGPAGALRLHLHDERGVIALEYRRTFESTVWSVAQATSDVGVLEGRYHLTPRLDAFANASIMRVSYSAPASATAATTTVTAPQYLIFEHAGLSVRLARWLLLDVFLDYRKQWGPGTPFPFESYMPGVTLTALLPPRAAPALAFEELVRRATREPLYDERRADEDEVEAERGAAPAPAAPPPPRATGGAPASAPAPAPVAPRPSRPGVPPGWAPGESP